MGYLRIHHNEQFLILPMDRLYHGIRYIMIYNDI